MIRTTSVLGLLVVLIVQVTGTTVQVDESICITDPKQKASLDALDAACKETGANPLEIIRLGLEKYKELNQQKAPSNATREIIRPEFDYYGLNSLFDEGDQAENAVDDDEEDGYGLRYLFNETNHTFGTAQVHEQTEQIRANKSSMFEDNYDDYYDLNRLYNEDYQAESSEKNSSAKWENPLDNDTDFGLKSLFNETEGEHVSPQRTNKPLDAESSPVDRVQSLYGKPNIPPIEIPADKMAENLRLSQSNSPWEMDGLDQDEYDDEGYDEDSLFDVPTTEKPPQEAEKIEATPKPNPQEASEPAKPISGQVETAPNSKPALEKSQPDASAKPGNVENKPINDERSAPVESKPAESKSVETHIDHSDPSDPKKVHIERRTESNVDPTTGAINHVHEETRTSSSVNGDKSSKQHYSRRSSHSSTSYSSSFAQPNNGRPKNKNNHHWNNKNKKQMQNKPAAFSAIPPLPPMVLPVIPMMPYNAGQPAWPGFYNAAAGQRLSKRQMKRLQQQQRQLQQYPFASSYGGAQAGASGAMASAYAGPGGAFAGAAGAFAGPGGAFAGAAAPYPYGLPGGNYNYNNNNNHNNNRRRAKNARRRARQQADQH